MKPDQIRRIKMCPYRIFRYGFCFVMIKLIFCECVHNLFTKLEINGKRKKYKKSKIICENTRFLGKRMVK